MSGASFLSCRLMLNTPNPDYSPLLPPILVAPQLQSSASRSCMLQLPCVQSLAVLLLRTAPLAA